MKHISKQIIFWFKQIFYLLMAIGFLGGLFYLRLIPRISRDLWENMNYSQICITICSITFLILHIYNLLKLLQYLAEKNNRYVNILKKWLSQLQQFVIKILYNFYLFFWNMTELLVEKITKRKYLIHYSIIRLLAQKFNKKPKFNYYCWSLLSIKFIPKIVFVIAFGIDVLIYHRLHYTFNCLPLVLLPLVEIFIIFVFQEFYDTNHAGVSSFIKKTPRVDSDLMDYSFISKYENTPPNFVKDFHDFFFNHYVVIHELQENLESYRNFKYNILHIYFVELLLSSIRLLLFIYILVYGIY